MSVFKHDNQLAVVSRMSYTTDSWYKKSWYSATGKSYTWHLKALSIKDGIDVNNFGKEFSFHTAYDADIKESDKLTIDNVNYDVKWVSKYKGISFSRLQAIIELCWT